MLKKKRYDNLSNTNFQCPFCEHFHYSLSSLLQLSAFYEPILYTTFIIVQRLFKPELEYMTKMNKLAMY